MDMDQTGERSRTWTRQVRGQGHGQDRGEVNDMVMDQTGERSRTWTRQVRGQ